MTATKDDSNQRNVMNTKEAAEYIGESPRTLEDWRSTGKGPRFFMNAGGKPRYRKHVLDEYMDKNEVDPRDAFESKIGDKSA